jgi:hypothetical protein
MAHGCACSHFTLITIRPIDERQRRTDALAERPRLRVAYTSRGVLRGLHYQLEPEPQGESDEPDAPLLLERELAVGEGDVVIGRKQSNQANNAAGRQVKNPASSRALPSNPRRHQDGEASRSRKSSFTLSSPPRLR